MKEFPNFVFMKRWTMIAKDNVNIFQFFANNSLGDSWKAARCVALKDLYKVCSDLNYDTMEYFNIA